VVRRNLMPATPDERLTLGEAIDRVRRNLGGEVNTMCYFATEAVYRLAGGKEAGFEAMFLGTNGFGELAAVHWFLRGPAGEVVDLTAGQFSRLPDYRSAVTCVDVFDGSPPLATRRLMKP
jgi:hypothetical protein